MISEVDEDDEPLVRRDKIRLDVSKQMIAGRKMMSVNTRWFVNILHWLAFLCFTALSIVSLYDGLAQGSDPKDFVYDDEDDALAAGVEANIGTISEGVYLSLLITCTSLSVLAFVWEWFIYRGTNFMGMDLTYNSVDAWSPQCAEMRARSTFIPRGTAYRMMYHSTLLCYVTTLSLFIWHIVQARALNRFSSVLVPLDTVLVVFYVWSMYESRYTPVDVSCAEINFSNRSAAFASRHLNRSPPASSTADNDRSPIDIEEE